MYEVSNLEDIDEEIMDVITIELDEEEGLNLRELHKKLKLKKPTLKLKGKVSEEYQEVRKLIKAKRRESMKFRQNTRTIDLPPSIATSLNATPN